MANTILDLPFILETRRNHALEHATLHVLAAKTSDQLRWPGIPTRPVFSSSEISPPMKFRSAVTQALTRLRAGERELAIHAGCGTNLATSALMAGTFAWFVMRGARSTFGRILRLPFAIVFAAGRVWPQPALGPRHSGQDHNRCGYGRPAGHGSPPNSARPCHGASGDHSKLKARHAKAFLLPFLPVMSYV